MTASPFTQMARERRLPPAVLLGEKPRTITIADLQRQIQTAKEGTPR